MNPVQNVKIEQVLKNRMILENRKIFRFFGLTKEKKKNNRNVGERKINQEEDS